MPQTRECDYCGGDIEPGTGTLFVQTDGSTVHFCSAKCEKNADLGREPRDLEWTAAGRSGETVGIEELDEPEPAEPAEGTLEPESGAEEESAEAEAAEASEPADAEPAADEAEAEAEPADVDAEGEESDEDASEADEGQDEEAAAEEADEEAEA